VSLNGNHPRTILLVDDDHDVAEALSTVLADEGYDVATASNGREALMYLRSHTAPRLILLDVMMPVMDGYEFRVEQQRDPAIADIPVVVLTAGSMGERVAELGVTAHMRKPVDLDRLLSEVAQRTDMRPTPSAPETLRAF
jgi:CheY-like chemotaxis protein